MDIVHFPTNHSSEAGNPALPCLGVAVPVSHDSGWLSFRKAEACVKARQPFRTRFRQLLSGRSLGKRSRAGPVAAKRRMDRDEVMEMTWNEIKTLVERAQTGDRVAYGELVERFQPTVYALALARLRNPAEAQELAQEVFLHGMRKLPQLRDAQCFAGWLRQITVRMAINRLTRRGPLQKVESEVLDNTEARSADPVQELERAEDAAELYRGLERLKPIDRATLMAFYIRGRSLKQMSREFETPVGTIKRRLHVARNRLKKVLEKAAAGVPEPATLPRRRRRENCEDRELACV